MNYGISFPFHFAVPVHDLELAKEFYGGLLGLSEGRSSDRWQDYNFFGNQLVCHLVGEDYRNIDYFNPVDEDRVPVPHMGAVLADADWEALAQKLTDAGIEFVIPPHKRFEG